MVCLSNKDSFKDNILTDILELGSTDLTFVAKDGSYSTQKLLIWSAFPALQNCLLDCFEHGGEVTVMLPGESVDKVQEGIVKMLLEGDLSPLESILGIKSSIDSHDHNKNNQHLSKTRKKLKIMKKKRRSNVNENSIDNCREIAEDIGNDDLLEEEVCVKEEIYLSDNESEEYETPPKKKQKNNVTCGKISKDEYNLSRPKKREHLQYNFACGECGKTFRDKFNLKRHLDRGHNNIKCKRCDEEFTGHEDFSVHVKTCWMRCEICDWVTQLKTGDSVDAHKRRHGKEGENCTFVSQKLEKEEVEAHKKQYNEHWKNKERHYTERITYVYKHRKDSNDSD
eukprot:GFUD01022857.1.p1 GENE.GFUD01022857.1~~GFUD01022857.1.p1  ORF type:complete len:339 (-),score=75.89 GFUD01022857.1:84-1100(-)